MIEKFLEIMLCKISSGRLYTAITTRETKEEGSRWPATILWHHCDHVVRFGRPSTAFVSTQCHAYAMTDSGMEATAYIQQGTQTFVNLKIKRRSK